MAIQKIDYQHRLVAFIDVMGFKELLKDKKKIQGYYDAINAHIENKIAEWIKNDPDADLKHLLVSDAIVLSIKFDKNHTKRLDLFIHTVGWVQYYLAVRDHWTRGAISVGDLYMDGEVLVGPAFVDAYDLEKLANYPRVIIDPKVCKAVNMSPKEFIALVNASKYPVKIMHLESQRMNHRFETSCMQIDWFSLAFRNTDELKPFFQGIRDRAVERQDLFEKARLLYTYLRESMVLEAHNIKNGFKGNEARFKEISDELERYGY